MKIQKSFCKFYWTKQILHDRHHKFKIISINRALQFLPNWPFKSSLNVFLNLNLNLNINSFFFSFYLSPLSSVFSKLSNWPFKSSLNERMEWMLTGDERGGEGKQGTDWSPIWFRWSVFKWKNGNILTQSNVST